MIIYYGTFGLKHKLADMVQPILAASQEEAEKIMYVVHGADYAFVYPVKPKDKQVLPSIKRASGMDVGEMYAWTSRLNNIISVAGPSKLSRLKTLSDDLEMATDLVNDRFAKKLFVRVGEEISDTMFWGELA